MKWPISSAHSSMPKPRLSMKLLWKLCSDYHTLLAKEGRLAEESVPRFLEFVENKLKTP